MNYLQITAILTVFSISMTSGYTQDPASSTVKSLSSQALTDALYKIGGTANDIGSLEKSGIYSSDLVRKFLFYTNNSNEPMFNTLLSSERDALVLFAFKLQSRNDISNSDLHSLMEAEKIRTGMTKEQIKELMSVFNTIKDNKNYELTHNDVRVINLASPFINKDPYSFADILGTLIEPILHATPEAIGIPASTETTLIEAAKTLTGLRQYKMDNLQSIADKYQSSHKFIPTADNIDDVTQVMEAAYYPNSASLLLPFLGADTLITLSKIPYAYPDSFNEDLVNYYTHEIALNPTVETYDNAGAYPRYNPNWANNRAQNRGDRPGTQYSKYGQFMYILTP
jgi:hypothetical protein